MAGNQGSPHPIGLDNSDAYDQAGSIASGITGSAAAVGGIASGIASFFGVDKWKLVGLDGDMKNKEIEGHFTASGYSEDVSTVWAELNVPRRAAPFIQWIRGESQTATFDALFFRGRDVIQRFKQVVGGDDILDDYKELKRSIQADKKLGRPPSFRFIMGDIEFDCVVESIGGVVFGDLTNFGTVKSINCSITLRKILVDATINLADPSALKNASRRVPVVRGETYETIAGTAYSSPLAGVLLRSVQDSDQTFVNPKIFPGVGDVVHVPDRKFFAGKSVRPNSTQLGGSVDAVATRQELIDSYAGSTTSPFIYQKVGG